MADVKPDDLVRPDLHSGAAGCVASAEATKLTGAVFAGRRMRDDAPTPEHDDCRCCESCRATQALLDRLIASATSDAVQVGLDVVVRNLHNGNYLPEQLKPALIKRIDHIRE